LKKKKKDKTLQTQMTNKKIYLVDDILIVTYCW